MGLPIWRSPPPSPRPAAATLCDAASVSRSAIRRRIASRASPRDGAHRFTPVSRASRPSSYSSARDRTVDSLESRSHAAAVSLSSLHARLNDLQEMAIELRNQHRQLQDVHSTNNGPSSASESPAPASPNDYGIAHEPDEYRRAGVNPTYERTINRYQSRLLRARQEIQRLETEGLQLSEQRRRLHRLHTEFYNLHMPEGSNDPYAPSTFYDLPRSRYPAYYGVSTSRDDSEPVPVLSVPERFTSSPQPMLEALSSGAVRAASTSSLSSAGPEMELPPLRRMGHRQVGGRGSARSPDSETRRRTRPMVRAYSVEEMVSELHDGLGDRDRSVEADTGSEENWSTMLSTIAPDDRLPSASSSFASDAASRPFSGGASDNSSRAASQFSARTNLTVPDVAAGEAPEDSGCDTEELWRSIGERMSRGDEVPSWLWSSAGVPPETARILARSRRERL